MGLYPQLNNYIKQLKQCDESAPDKRPILIFQEIEKPLKFNSRILGHFITRTTALKSFDYNLSGDFYDIEKVKTRNKNILDKIISNHTYAPLFKSSLYKLILNNNELGSQLLIEKKYKNYDYDFDEQFIYFFDKGKFINKTEIGLDNFYLLDKEDYLPFGGILRVILLMEIIRFDIIIENANYLRKLKGILQIMNKGGSTESEKAAETAAQTAIQNNYLITDEMIEFKLNQIASTPGSSFKDFIDLINSENSIAILGQANTSQLPNNGGSRAALQILNLISKDIFYSDMVRVEKLCNEVLQFDFNLNYGEGEKPYQFKFNIEEEQDIEKNANVLETVSKIIPLKESEAYASVGFTPPELGDKILQVKQQLF